MFQSTHPHGVRPAQANLYQSQTHVSIHAPTRGATYCPRLWRLLPFCFNPRTHTGCDICIVEHKNFHYVSIHAPTRGATSWWSTFSSEYEFQSTHPHGVRHKHCLRNSQHFLFQSTHPHGVRPVSVNKSERSRCFNPRTHTGCDIMHLCPLTRLCTFQSTHPHGVRPPNKPRTPKPSKFQSTHPHGVRRPEITIIVERPSFNPRTHTGCDTRSAIRCPRMKVSIHAPTRGATPLVFLVHRLLQSFNPRTHTGCDLFDRRGIRLKISFNPRTHTGCDVKNRRHQNAMLVSIHAPTRGATGRLLKRQQAWSVSIHAPTRGATDQLVAQGELTKVSIHAPTRGATSDNLRSSGEAGVSIHAPTRGATGRNYT